MGTKLKGAVPTLPLLLLFFVSGATTLVYEISWTRQAGLLFGHTVLAGSVVLASLFFGLAIGYSVGGRLSVFWKITPVVWRLRDRCGGLGDLRSDAAECVAVASDRRSGCRARAWLGSSLAVQASVCCCCFRRRWHSVRHCR